MTIIKIRIKKKSLICFQLVLICGVLPALAAGFAGYAAVGGSDDLPLPSPAPTALSAETMAGIRETKSYLWYSEDDEPVEFLEEITPILSPDPDRETGKVVETDASGNINVGSIAVNDTSGSDLDLEELLDAELPFSIEKNSKEPQILIYHTHTTESYMGFFGGFYYRDESFRNTDKSKTVCAVGEKLKKTLEKAGYTVIHDTTVYDAPAFNGAYQRSMDSVQGYLAKYPGIKVTIDLHRDAIGDGKINYKPTVTVGGRKAAQMMIITGSDPTGELAFENWYDNLIFSLKLQQKATEKFPGIMRPLMFCQRKYNMDATNASFLIEVGTQVNTLREAEYSGALFGEILAEVLDEAS